MKLSLSIHALDIVNRKKSFLEKIMPRHTIVNSSTFEDALTFFKKVGLSGIELKSQSHISHGDLLYIKKLLKKYNVPVLSVHQPTLKVFHMDIKDIEKLCEIAKLFSSTLVVLHMHTIGRQLKSKHFINQLKYLEKKYHIHFVLENSPNHIAIKFQKHWWKEKEYAKFVSEIGFGINLDTAHLGTARGDIIRFANNHFDKIKNIHLSDYKIASRKQHMLLGKGNLPIEKFLKVLAKHKYKGIVTFEVHANIFSVMENAYYVKSFILGIDAEKQM